MAKAKQKTVADLKTLDDVRQFRLKVMRMEPSQEKRNLRRALHDKRREILAAQRSQKQE